MGVITVLIVDDHEIFRNGLKSVLNEIHFIKVIGETWSEHSLFQKIKKDSPDIIFMDIRLKDSDGIKITKKIKEKYPDIKIIGLTSYEDISYLKAMLKAGASGHLLKNTNKSEIEKALITVIKGGTYIASEFNIKLDSIAEQGTIKLTQREKDILELICQGCTNQEISEKLFISIKTVEYYKTELMLKTNTKNSAELAYYAVKNNIVK